MLQAVPSGRDMVTLNLVMRVESALFIRFARKAVRRP